MVLIDSVIPVFGIPVFGIPVFGFPVVSCSASFPDDATGIGKTAIGETGISKTTENANHASAFFEKRIRPLLVSKCLSCHGSGKQEGGLRLDSHAAMLEGGDSGPAVVPGDVESSLLIEAVRRESLEMPPDETLSDKHVQSLVEWVRTGAEWPDADTVLRSERIISDADREWWAFQPLNAAVPEVESAWTQTEVDRFVLQQMNARGLTPAPQAPPEVLLRRAYLHMLGVPPTPEDYAALSSALITRPWNEVWPEWVEAILEDPRYGEHWGRYWLDLVRYAESDGWNQDAYRPHIWRYRDYVVQSFNEDKPYQQFVREQLAGDEFAGDSAEGKIAVGFLRLGIYEYNQRDARGHWNDIMNEMTDVVGDVFFGMSMACARCHDHKFDPILQTDYFQLRAFFEPIQWRDDLDILTAAEKQQYERDREPWLKATKEVRRELDELVKPYHDKKWKSTVGKFPLEIQACFNKAVSERNSWEDQMAYLVFRQFEEEGGGPLKSLSKEDKAQHEELKKRLAEFDDIKPKPPSRVMTVTNFPGNVAATSIPGQNSPPVQPGFPQVLETRLPPLEDLSAKHRRRLLADWISDPSNSLTHRVAVNRIWLNHFGEGLVGSPSDFGALGRLPTHPALLDWLTDYYIVNDGRMKPIHRVILNSAVWQQSAIHPNASEYEKLDPDEKWLWRSRVRRLTAEQIRDSMLSVTGELSPTLGGPGVNGDSKRRTIYVKRMRNNLDKFLYVFDAANGLKSVPQRSPTTTPNQALMLINGKYTIARASQFAERLRSRQSPLGDSLRWAVKSSWGRDASDEELLEMLAYLGAESDTPNAAVERSRLDDLCHALLNSNAFLYTE